VFVGSITRLRSTHIMPTPAQVRRLTHQHSSPNPLRVMSYLANARALLGGHHPLTILLTYVELDTEGWMKLQKINRSNGLVGKT